MPTLPIDILVHIFEYVDDLKDLLAFASTSRFLHAVIVPRHSDYRRIVCPESAKHVWKHLLETPNACAYTRYLNTTSISSPGTKIPRPCPIDWDFVYNDALNLGTQALPVVDEEASDAFLQALSKMVNLKVLAFETAGRGQSPIWAVSEAIERAGCHLEEIEVHFRFMNEVPHTGDMDSEEGMLNQYFEENKKPRTSRNFSLLYDYLPSLRKYTISADACFSLENNVFLQMLANAPNLTHINVTLAESSPALLLGYWPDLQHLTLYPHNLLQIHPLVHDYTLDLRSFFSRHSKLITLSADYVFIPGWAIESDDFLPNLRSLGMSRHSSEGPIITSHIAARLIHVDMNTPLCSYLKDNGIVLSSVESCRYRNANPRASIQDLIDVIPNVKKLHMTFGYYMVENRPTTSTLPSTSPYISSRQLTDDEIVERVTLFSGFKNLHILVGLFDGIDISVSEDHPLLKILYSMPSLVYTRVLLRNHFSQLSFLRLERDDIAGVRRYEYVKALPDEYGDVRSWGGFYDKRA